MCPQNSNINYLIPSFLSTKQPCKNTVLAVHFYLHLSEMNMLKCMFGCVPVGERAWLNLRVAMPMVVDAVWALWSIGAGIYDYFHTSAIEDRIHTLENVLSIHQFVIACLSAGLILLMTYILWRKLWLELNYGISCYHRLLEGGIPLSQGSRTIWTWDAPTWIRLVHIPVESYLRCFTLSCLLLCFVRWSNRSVMWSKVSRP